jgi:hypothetical protein
LLGCVQPGLDNVTASLDLLVCLRKADCLLQCEYVLLCRSLQEGVSQLTFSLYYSFESLVFGYRMFIIKLVTIFGLFINIESMYCIHICSLLTKLLFFFTSLILAKECPSSEKCCANLELLLCLKDC